MAAGGSAALSIDLHTHTTASDGSLAPSELVGAALTAGLAAVAITDHDTTDGVAEGIEAGKRSGVEVVPGIEISIDYPGSGQLHLLGLLIDPSSSELIARLGRLRENRRTRNLRMIEKLQALGIPITVDDVRREAGGGVIGRPHMALAMVHAGAVATVTQAFDRYLGAGAAAHVPKDKIGIQEGIDLVHAAGGLAVLAHPLSLHLDDAVLRRELARLRTLGLDGVECYYSQYPGGRTETLLGMARTAGLLASGGSDFHGTSKPTVAIGAVCEGAPAPYALLSAMRERWNALHRESSQAPAATD